MTPDSRDNLVEVFTRCITTKNGKRIYKADGGVFHFWAPSKEAR